MQSSRGLGNHGYGRLQAMHLLTVSVAMALTQSSDKMSCDWQLSKTSLAERIQFVLKSSHWSDCSFCVGREGNSQKPLEINRPEENWSQAVRNSHGLGLTPHSLRTLTY
ncbi:unnamed protein product, partial [Timema podura]|nr:unnamed protein product [Timema podura]